MSIVICIKCSFFKVFYLASITRAEMKRKQQKTRHLYLIWASCFNIKVRMLTSHSYHSSVKKDILAKILSKVREGE